MSENELAVNVRFRNCPSSGKLIFTLDGSNIKIRSDCDADKWSAESEYSVYYGTAES